MAPKDPILAGGDSNSDSSVDSAWKGLFFLLKIQIESIEGESGTLELRKARLWIQFQPSQMCEVGHIAWDFEGSVSSPANKS